MLFLLSAFSGSALTGFAIVAVVVVVLFVVGIIAVFTKCRRRCKSWLFGVKMFTPDDKFSGRVSTENNNNIKGSYLVHVHTVQCAV